MPLVLSEAKYVTRIIFHVEISATVLRVANLPRDLNAARAQFLLGDVRYHQKEYDAAIVEYFEIIKEKYPEVEIDFPSIFKVGRAYRELGEYERSYLVFRATLEAAFQREGRIAGVELEPRRREREGRAGREADAGRRDQPIEEAKTEGRGCHARAHFIWSGETVALSGVPPGTVHLSRMPSSTMR